MSSLFPEGPRKQVVFQSLCIRSGTKSILGLLTSYLGKRIFHFVGMIHKIFAFI